MWGMLATPLAKVASKILDEVITTDEERSAAKLKFAALMQEGKLKELEVSMSAIVAEAKSRDPWTSRARPTFLYLVYAIIIGCFFFGSVGVFFPLEINQAADNISVLLHALPEQMWMLFGVGYLGYTGARSYDKQQILKGEK